MNGRNPAFKRCITVLLSCLTIISALTGLAYIRKLNLDKLNMQRYEEHMKFHELEKEFYTERGLRHE